MFIACPFWCYNSTGVSRWPDICRAKALDYGYEACLRRLIQATQVAFVHVACPFRGQAGVVHATIAYLL